MFDGQQLGEDIVSLVRGFMEREIGPLKAENAELKQRIAALEARPAPEKGEKGDAGDPGKDGRDGADGQNGADGRGVKELLIDREGHLIATMDDGELKKLGPVVGADGKKGKDGRDGLGFEDMDVAVLDDDRTIELSFRRGEEEKAFTLKWPTAIYRGVFADGMDYDRGDCVTWAGSMWHCDAPTKEKPGTEHWTLAAKKGRDGKDAKPNG